MSRDMTDQVLDAWAAARPELGGPGLQVAARLSRVGRHVALLEADAFGRFGLNRGDVGVLSALRVAGPPHRLSPTRLGKGLMLSSAGVTSRLDRLERRGLLARLPDPADRRGVIVELTPEGLETVDEAVAAYTVVERRLLTGLAPAEVARLADLLRMVLAGLEPGSE